MKKLLIIILLCRFAVFAETPGTPKIIQITACPTGMAVVFYAEKGRRVEIQQSSDLSNWESVSTNIPTGALSAFIDTNNCQCRFYRMKVTQ